SALRRMGNLGTLYLEISWCVSFEAIGRGFQMTICSWGCTEYPNAFLIANRPRARRFKVLHWMVPDFVAWITSLPCFRALLILVLALSCFARGVAQVEAAPVPNEMRNSFFAITVNNQRVDVA